LSRTNESLTAAHVRTTGESMICFVQKCNWVCYNFGCLVFRNR